MRGRLLKTLSIALLLLLAPAQTARSADTAWEQVAPGVDYQVFWLPGPNRVYVARMDRANPAVILETGIAKGSFSRGTETVSSMARRYDQALNTWDGWGSRNQVVVAINGSFFDPESGIPETGMLQSGWYAKRFNDLGGSSGFAWTRDRSAYIGGCVIHRQDRQRLSFVDAGLTVEVDAINFPENGLDITLYTPQLGESTPPSADRLEISIEVTNPVGVIPLPRQVQGYVRSISLGQGSTPIPFDHVVVSVSGAVADMLQSQIKPGMRVGFSAEITHYESDCRTPSEDDWSSTYASLGGSFHFLRDGQVQTFDDLGATQRHPRTAICYNDRYIHFIVVDGRQSGYSAGMSMAELGAFCTERLESPEGLNQDGGGSSTFWMTGSVRNRPSEGEERQVANGWMMVVVQPPERSASFLPGEQLLVTQLADVRLGPGNNYPGIADVQPGDTGVVLPHLNQLNGILAKGTNWWKLSFGEVQGWVDQRALAPDPAWQALWRWHPPQ